MKGKQMKYVYVYLDPVSRVVRYVGSGLRDRIYEHTKPGYLSRVGSTPFYDWIREQIAAGVTDWVRHRMVVEGPMCEEDALYVEAEWIKNNFETVLNKRCPLTNVFLKPMKQTPREPYGPRSESGRAKERVAERRRATASPGSSKAGRGVGRHGSGWRMTFTHLGKVTRKGHKTFCEALKHRKALEDEHWEAVTRDTSHIFYELREGSLGSYSPPNGHIPSN
jgi:hypothetical protein